MSSENIVSAEFLPSSALSESAPNTEVLGTTALNKEASYSTDLEAAALLTEALNRAVLDKEVFGSPALDTATLLTNALDKAALPITVLTTETLHQEALHIAFLNIAAFNTASLDRNALYFTALEAEALHAEALSIKALDTEDLHAEVLSIKVLDTEALSIKALDTEALSIKALDTEALSIKALDTTSSDVAVQDDSEFVQRNDESDSKAGRPNEVILNYKSNTEMLSNQQLPCVKNDNKSAGIEGLIIATSPNNLHIPPSLDSSNSSFCPASINSSACFNRKNVEFNVDFSARRQHQRRASLGLKSRIYGPRSRCFKRYARRFKPGNGSSHVSLNNLNLNSLARLNSPAYFECSSCLNNPACDNNPAYDNSPACDHSRACLKSPASLGSSSSTESPSIITPASFNSLVSFNCPVSFNTPVSFRPSSPSSFNNPVDFVGPTAILNSQSNSNSTTAVNSFVRFNRPTFFNRPADLTSFKGFNSPVYFDCPVYPTSNTGSLECPSRNNSSASFSSPFNGPVNLNISADFNSSVGYNGPSRFNNHVNYNYLSFKDHADYNSPISFKSFVNLRGPARFNSPVCFRKSPVTFSSPADYNSPATCNSPVTFSSPADYNGLANLSSPDVFNSAGIFNCLVIHKSSATLNSPAYSSSWSSINCSSDLVTRRLSSGSEHVSNSDSASTNSVGIVSSINSVSFALSSETADTSSTANTNSTNSFSFALGCLTANSSSARNPTELRNEKEQSLGRPSIILYARRYSDESVAAEWSERSGDLCERELFPSGRSVSGYNECNCNDVYNAECSRLPLSKPVEGSTMRQQIARSDVAVLGVIGAPKYNVEDCFKCSDQPNNNSSIVIVEGQQTKSVIECSVDESVDRRHEESSSYGGGEDVTKNSTLVMRELGSWIEDSNRPGQINLPYTKNRSIGSDTERLTREIVNHTEQINKNKDVDDLKLNHNSSESSQHGLLWAQGDHDLVWMNCERRAIKAEQDFYSDSVADRALSSTCCAEQNSAGVDKALLYSYKEMGSKDVTILENIDNRYSNSTESFYPNEERSYKDEYIGYRENRSSDHTVTNDQSFEPSEESLWDDEDIEDLEMCSYRNKKSREREQAVPRLDLSWLNEDERGRVSVKKPGQVMRAGENKIQEETISRNREATQLIMDERLLGECHRCDTETLRKAISLIDSIRASLTNESKSRGLEPDTPMLRLPLNDKRVQLANETRSGGKLTSVLFDGGGYVPAMSVPRCDINTTYSVENSEMTRSIKAQQESCKFLTLPRDTLIANIKRDKPLHCSCCCNRDEEPAMFKFLSLSAAATADYSDDTQTKLYDDSKAMTYAATTADSVLTWSHGAKQVRKLDLSDASLEPNEREAWPHEDFSQLNEPAHCSSIQFMEAWPKVIKSDTDIFHSPQSHKSFEQDVVLRSDDLLGGEQQQSRHKLLYYIPVYQRLPTRTDELAAMHNYTHFLHVTDETHRYTHFQYVTTLLRRLCAYIFCCRRKSLSRDRLNSEQVT